MKALQKVPKNEEELIQAFVGGLSNLIAVERAKYVARKTEEGVVQGLNSIYAHNGIFVTPEDITEELGEQMVKDSVNAHLTKVQSEQISQVTKQEISNLESQVKQKYIGTKIKITVNNPKSDVVDAVLIDSRTSEYRVTRYNAKNIKGTIEDISFENNLLVIKPTLTARLIVPNRIQIHVYVIDLETMVPNIKIIM